MRPSGALMIEHRLIERMLAIMEGGLPALETIEEVDLVFVDAVVDFVRFYADRTHHGKEEDILFREMAQKQMTPEHLSMMQDLIKEHRFARDQVARLADAREACMRGEPGSGKAMATAMRTLIDFYPGHIEKEDKTFFPAAMSCLTKDEQAAMLAEFWEFDRKMIHEKYKTLVERWESPPA